MTIRKSLIKDSVAILFAFSAVTVAAAEVELPFSYGQGENLEYGTQKKENYDIAMRIIPGDFTGDFITGISVPVRTEGISNIRVWLSKELTVELVDGKRVTVPDIVQLDATVIDGIAKASLATPYEIPADGVYAGYSFDVETLTDDTKWPLFVSASDGKEGFYMRTSRSYRDWQNFSSDYKVATELSINIRSEYDENSVKLVSVGTTRASYGEPFKVPVVIENHGYATVKSIDFDYRLGESETGSCHFELPQELPAIYRHRMNITLPFEKCGVRFNNPLAITLTKVNGQENKNSEPTATGAVNIVNHEAHHRVVMEEYTGTWCGFCVKGTAAIERLKSIFGEDFIPIAIHGGNSDPMVTVDIFPNYVEGYPTAYVERNLYVDPYYGLGSIDEGFGIENVIRERLAQPVAADIEVTADIDEDNNVNVQTAVYFVEIPDAQYKLGYILTEDHLKPLDRTWSQSNYYAGNKPENYIPEMERFCNGNSYITDIEYNEVAVMAPDIMGVNNSVAFVDCDTPVNHKYTFNKVTEAKNQFGKTIVQNTGNLSVVVLLLDTADGHIVNAAKAKVSGESGSATIVADSEIESVSYFSLDGRQLTTPCSGLVIKQTRYTNGTTTVEKTLVR